MITTEKAAELVTKFGKSSTDTGSTAVQVALITERIKNLTGHFGKHIHDFHGRRGLMKLIGRRRRLLRYLQNTNFEDYTKLIAELGLRK